MSYLYLPFISISILMGIDEVFHLRRGLGLWERFGHPLDSLTVFVPLSYIAINEFSEDGLLTYALLAVFSCLFITKDEWIHTKECVAMENWLHSMLFILHPVVFFCTGIIWRYHPENEFLTCQAVAVGLFMMYQICRWSITWKQRTR